MKKITIAFSAFGLVFLFQNCAGGSNSDATVQSSTTGGTSSTSSAGAMPSSALIQSGGPPACPICGNLITNMRAEILVHIDTTEFGSFTAQDVTRMEIKVTPSSGSGQVLRTWIRSTQDEMPPINSVLTFPSGADELIEVRMELSNDISNAVYAGSEVITVTNGSSTSISITLTRL